MWFTHYPSATISTDHRELRHLMGASVVHVCGHLHTLGGLMPHMYGKHPSGHLELELGDFKDNRRYFVCRVQILILIILNVFIIHRFRLMVFDHDLFSFIDATVGNWPLVLVTNPKNAKFLAATREPINRMLKSSHIRILVFCPEKIESIELEVDGQALSMPVAVNGGPLYVSPWQPNDYTIGLHDINVKVRDAIGRVTIYTHPFSLDGTPSPIEKLPQLLLLTDLHSLVSNKLK